MHWTKGGHDSLKELNFYISKITTKIKISVEWKGIAKDNWDSEVFHKNNSIKTSKLRAQSLVTYQKEEGKL